MTTYIKTHGARLRWVMHTLTDAGIDVQRVDRGLGADYYIVADADEKTVDAALATLTNYQRKPKRKPIAMRAMDLLLVAGVVVAGVVALVTPLGGAVVLGTLALVRLAFGNMHRHARELADLGGKWRLYAVLVVMLVMMLVAGFIAIVGGMAAAEIADGNSALSLLGR